MRPPEAFSFTCPMKVNCGSHALTTIPNELVALGAGAPLLLVNRNQTGKKQLKAVVGAFQGSQMVLGIYDRVTELTAPDGLMSLAQIYKGGGHDCIIAVGSGPVVDVSKCLNLLVSTTNAVDWQDAVRHIADPEPLQPLMLVSAAGGSGYEATGHVRLGGRRLCSLRLAPDVAFIDPAMMGEPNDHEVVNGALIALVNAVEAFLDEDAGPVSHAYAHVAISLILKMLPMVIRNIEPQKNLCALVNGQMAAGCAAADDPSGLCHRLAAQLKAWIDLPLGFLMAAVLPHLAEDIGTFRADRVGQLLYPMAGPDIYAMTAQDLKKHRAIAMLWEFFDAINAELVLKIPASLADVGLTADQVDRIQLQADDRNAKARIARIIAAARGAFP